jgi:MOSC domain-containing protein YiiM
MGKVLKIGISKAKRNKILELSNIEVVQGCGIVNDRYFSTNNKKMSQLTLIEIENINYYNKIYKSDIPPTEFRRNIVTEGIVLNNLLNKEFFIGNIRVKAHHLCHPCKHLENFLNQKNLVKELLIKGGLRCEILSSGKIFVNDVIEENKND